MKHNLLILFLLFSINSFTQVGIGTTTPTESLDVMGAIALDHQKTLSNRGQWQVTRDFISGNWIDITPATTLSTGTYLCETTFQSSYYPAHLWYVRLSYTLSYTAISNSWDNNSYYNIPLSISSHHTDNVNFNMRIKIVTGQNPCRIELQSIGNGSVNNITITTKYVKLF